jgi:hypothetical protein
VVFDAESVVEPEFIAHLKFAPQFLITLMRSHARLAPDMREMGELHCGFSSGPPSGAFGVFKGTRVVSMFPTVEDTTMDDKTRTELEAAVYRRLVEHLRSRTDVQNIDLMNLAGFCRNCLSNWMKEAADAQGLAMSKDESREIVYGMPFDEWRNKYQKEASPDRKEAFEKSRPRH